MMSNIEKLSQHAKNRSKDAVNKEKYLLENSDWLRMSAEIALSVQFLLKQKKMTQLDLARFLNVSAASVAKWLSGKENLTIKTICKIQKALEEDIVEVQRPYFKKNFNMEVIWGDYQGSCALRFDGNAYKSTPQMNAFYKPKCA